ncbi:tetratricopeptide repeat protein [Hymenobacter edaphi]|nr:tetratricopeptide repeat protein [Hymenobacter edaphi]
MMLLALPALGQRAQPVDAVALGRYALDRGDGAGASRHFSAALQRQPDNEEALGLRCKARYQLKDYAGTLADAERVLAINPEQFTQRDYEALRNLGVIQNSRRDFEAARRYLQQAKAKHGADTQDYEDIGYSYLQQQNGAAALAEFQAMVKLDPQSKKARYGVGKSLYLLQRFPESVAAFDEAIKLDPGYALAYQNRGAAKMSAGDQAGGCRDWQKASELGVGELRPLLKQYCP